METLWTAVSMALSPGNIGFLLLGSIVGLVIGILPGLGPVFAVALFLPFTFGLPTDQSLILLAALYASTAYGDGITSILLNVPGGPSGVAVTFDGYPLTREGKAGLALGALAGASFIGGIIGVGTLITIAPPLADFSLKIGPAEYFMLAMFGLSMVAVAGKGDTAKGLILGCLGLVVSFIGSDVITGAKRFTFGNSFLEDGVSFVSASIGLFALSQAFILAEEGGSIAGGHALVTNPWKGFLEAVKNWLVALRSAAIGVGIGMVPGVGISTASFISYLTEQRLSKNPESYGKGNIRGVIAPQAATNACVSGELIPALSLGIPGGSTAAIFIAALTLHGLRPGLDFFKSGGVTVNTVFVGMILAQVLFLLLGMTATPLFARVTKVPNSILVPIIIVLSFIGAFAVHNQVEDVIVAIVFGLIGYVLFKYNWPVPCLVLGMVLGNLAESNFHRSLQIASGSYAIFIQKPISLIFFILIILLVIWTYMEEPIKMRRQRRKRSVADNTGT